MKNLVFAAILLGGLSQATGCIISSDDSSSDGSFLVSWDLQSRLAATPGAISCTDAGVTTIRTTSQPVGGGMIVDLFDCGVGVDETAPLPQTDYTVWVDALDSANALVAESFSQDASIFDTNPVGVNFSFPVNIGYFGLTWTLVNSGSPVTCADVGGDGLSILSTGVNGGGSGIDEIFDCTDGTATTTSDLPLDDYTVSITLIDANDQPLNTPENKSTSLDYGNQLQDLGNFEFDFTQP